MSETIRHKVTDADKAAGHMAVDLKKRLHAIRKTSKTSIIRFDHDYRILDDGSKTFYIQYGDQLYDGIESLTDVGRIFKRIYQTLEDLRDTRGWGGLVIDRERVMGGSSGRNWIIAPFFVINAVRLHEEPCKEYKALQRYVSKYGRKRGGIWGSSSFELGCFRLYSAAMGGKRGVLWDEYGQRHYLDNEPERCKAVLDGLRKARTAKDTMYCEFGEQHHIDEEERRISAYHEVECEGEMRKFLEIKIVSPSGKIKYNQKIY